MAVPDTNFNSVSLYGIAKELKVDDYNSTIPQSTFFQFQADDISLGDMCTSAGDFTDAPINHRQLFSHPDGFSPHSMSEFRLYDHDNVVTFNTSTNVTYYSFTNYAKTYISQDLAQGRVSRGFTDPSNTVWNPDPLAKANRKWRILKFKVNAGQSVLYRPVIVFYADGTDYRRDFCINSLRRTVGSSTVHYHPEVHTPLKYHSTSSGTPTSESSWSNVTTGSTANQWNRETGGSTPSANTGPDDGLVWNSFTSSYEDSAQYAADPCDYWYFEASSSATGYSWWKPSATVPIGGGNTDEWEFIYSAWSDAESSWGNSYFEIKVQVTAII